MLLEDYTFAPVHVQFTSGSGSGLRWSLSCTTFGPQPFPAPGRTSGVRLPVLCLWRVLGEGAKESWSVGMYMEAGVSQIIYKAEWKAGPPAPQAPRCFSSHHFLSDPHRTPTTQWDWASGKSGQGWFRRPLIGSWGSAQLILALLLHQSCSYPEGAWRTLQAPTSPCLKKNQKVLIYEPEAEYSWTRCVSNYFLLGSFEQSSHPVLSFYSCLLLNNCFIIYLHLRDLKCL